MKKFLLILFVLGQFNMILAQSINLTGKVTGESGEALIGVNIIEKGTSNGAATDIDGNYTIQLSNSNVSVIYSYIGYDSEEINVNGRSSIDIIMKESATSLDELVVVGYGTQRKSVVTGAIAKVKGEDLQAMPVARIEQSLAGRTSGVLVTTNSGQPGAAATVRIRGTTTINNSDPLFVVDGVPVDIAGIDYLNQGDIESIEVLKDAASAAIYGARAANGVILVTTKKGTTGKMTVNYNGYYGLQRPWRKLSVLNASQYGVLMNESSVASGGSLLFENPSTLGIGTDWQDEVFNMDAPIQQSELSISSGGDRSTYYASFGYFNQDGIIAKDDSKYRRFTARINSTHKISPKVTFGNNISYSRVDANGVAENEEWGSPLGRAINMDPVTPVIETNNEVLNSDVFQNFPVVRNSQGQPYGISQYISSEILNPIAALQVQQGNGHSDKVVGNVYLEAEVLNGLKLKTSAGADLAFWGNENFTPIHFLNTINRKDLTSYGREQNRGLNWIWTNTLSYQKVVGSHNFSALVGMSAEQNKGRAQGGSIQDIPVDNIEDASLSFFTALATQSFYGYEYENKLNSYFGRLNYNFGGKYLFSGTVRVDGSSKFGSNNRYGTFPSVSAGWVLTEEPFFSRSNIFNFLKLRASWGVNGNDKIGDNRFVSLVGGGRNYTIGNQDVLVNGVSPNAIANPDLRWEETTQTDIGIDAVIFRKFKVTLDYFYKETTDMLLDIAVPGYVGNSGPVGNVATMENQGFEFEFTYNDKVGEFNFDLATNLSLNRNKVTFLGQDKEFLFGQRFGPQGLEITRTAVGHPIGFLFGYRTDGIFQNAAEIANHTGTDGILQPDAKPGDFRFKDLNGDGVLDSDDREQIGDPTPSWTVGLNLNFEWRNFDLKVFGQGVVGNDIFKATRRFDLNMANLTTDALGRWTGEGSTDLYPRLAMNDANNNFSRSSDFYVEDGSYFRIKTLQLGYTLPSSILSKVSMSNLRIYVSGNNLLTITDYSGFDPEIGGGSFGVDRGIYPQPRFFLLGLSASF